MRTKRTFACGWQVSPVCRNIRDRSVIYTVKPLKEGGKPKSVNAIALALAFRKMLDESEVTSQAQLAEKVGLSRPRVTQLLNLLRLPELIIEEMSGTNEATEIAFFRDRCLRPLTNLTSGREQLDAFATLKQELARTRT